MTLNPSLYPSSTAYSSLPQLIIFTVPAWTGLRSLLSFSSTTVNTLPRDLVKHLSYHSSPFSLSWKRFLLFVTSSSYLRQTRKSFPAVWWSFSLFPSMVLMWDLKAPRPFLLGWKGILRNRLEPAHCSAIGAVLHLIWFWYSSSVMLIPSIWWIFFMFFWFKYPFYLFWFSISLLVNAYRHQIPQWATSELPGSVLLFKLTMGELHCWLNPSSSWVELLAEHSRYWERRFLFISRWKLCSLSQFAQHIHHPGLSGCTSEGHIWSGGDWFRWFSAVFCCSTSAFFSRGLLGSCPFGFHSLAQRLSWFPSKPLSFFYIRQQHKTTWTNSIRSCKLPGCLQWGSRFGAQREPGSFLGKLCWYGTTVRCLIN